jgi:uncharacterized protein
MINALCTYRRLGCLNPPERTTQQDDKPATYGKYQFWVLNQCSTVNQCSTINAQNCATGHNRKMLKKRLKDYLPSPLEVRRNPALKPVAHLLTRSEIWHLNRRSAAGAVFIGLFCAFLPIPLQMVVAAALAIATRCNLPISIALVWITNPITIPPMFYFTYRLGAWLLDMQITDTDIQLSFGWIWDNLGTIGYPLLVGSIVCGWVAGVTGFVMTRVLWRVHAIRRWQARREKIKARRALRAQKNRQGPGSPGSSN